MINDINEIIREGMCQRLEVFRRDADCQARAMGVHVDIPFIVFLIHEYTPTDMCTALSCIGTLLFNMLG